MIASSIHSMIEGVAQWALRASWQAAVLALVIGVIQAAFGKRLAPRWRYALWGLVVARLLMPGGVRTHASAWNYLGKRDAVTPVHATALPIVTPGTSHPMIESVYVVHNAS